MAILHTDTQTERAAIRGLRERVELLARSTSNGAKLVSMILPVVGPGPAADALQRAQQHLIAAAHEIAPLRTAVYEVAPDAVTTDDDAANAATVAAPARRVH
ncbi:MAG: hypothetical protein OXH69_19350 [Acidobacteria bacterium]|nr:hypothetical protein [Acidobacteriota bacterium]